MCNRVCAKFLVLGPGLTPSGEVDNLVIRQATLGVQTRETQLRRTMAFDYSMNHQLGLQATFPTIWQN